MPKPWQDAKKVAVAEDEVYEAVVREVVGQDHLGQLVFDQMVLTGINSFPELSPDACKANVLASLPGNRDKPQFDSMADKTYRFVTDGVDSHSVREDTIENFAVRSCTNGRLSQTFHTDVARTFIANNEITFKDWDVPNDPTTQFEKRFPGARGIISLSHAGFDANLDEAIVSTAFNCGGLCGDGKIFILQKRQGIWQIVGQRTFWVA